jgi:dienelactone hydrolase
MGVPHSGCPLLTHVRVRFVDAPRAGAEGGNAGQVFGSNDGPGDGLTLLGELPAAATEDGWRELRLSRSARFRFLSYLAPLHPPGRLAEVEFWSGGRRIRGTPFLCPARANSPPAGLARIFDGCPDTGWRPPAPPLLVGLDLGQSAQVAPPRFLPPPGVYPPPLQVRILPPRPHTEIRFWTHDVFRGAPGHRYTAPVTLTHSLTLAAVARRPGFADSPRHRGAYCLPRPPKKIPGALYEENLQAAASIRVAQWRQMTAYVRALENAGPPANPSAAPRSPAAEADFVAGWRARFIRRIGWPPPGFLDTVPPAHLVRVGEDALATYYRCRVRVTPEMETYGLYLVPKNARRPAPLVIAQHGGGGFPELATFHDGSNYHDLVRGAAAQGWVVFAPLLLFHPFRDRDHGTPIPSDARAGLDRRLRALNTTLAAVEVAKISRALDALLRQPEVDAFRVAMIGLSYGGYYTLYTTALDSRIRAAAVAGAFCDWGTPEEDFATPAEWQPGGQLNDVLPAELAALICPRPLLVEAGTRDRLMKIAPTRVMAAKARELYERLGGAGRFQFREFSGGHEFQGEPVWRFLQKVFECGPGAFSSAPSPAP